MMRKTARQKLSFPYSLTEAAATLWLIVFTGIALIYSFLPQMEKSMILDLPSAYLPPFQNKNHPLGTDPLGRDLLFYLLHACQTAWFLTFPPLFVSTALGTFLGGVSAFWGNTGIRIRVISLVLAVAFLIIAVSLAPVFEWHIAPLFLSNNSPTFIWSLYVALWVFIFLILRISIKRIKGLTFTLPLDTIVQKAVEVWSTLPKLLLLLLLSTLAPNSLLIMMGWIAVSYWVLPCRITRAKVLELKGQPFIEAAQALGLPTQTLFLKHFFPFLKNPIILNFCFSASGLLGIGATLAFLGVGLPPETPSWGKLLASSRLSTGNWWLLLFPGSLLLLSILSLQTLGQRFSSQTRR